MLSINSTQMLKKGGGLFFCVMCLFFFSCWLFYPGFISVDSIFQLSNARNWTFSMTHPPLMGLLWRCFDLIVPGSGGIFLFIQGIYWWGIYKITDVLSPSLVRRCVYLFILGLWPPYFFLLPDIWKDCLTLSFFVLGTGFLFQFSRNDKILHAFISLGLFTLGALFRHNTFLIPAVILLAIFGSSFRKLKWNRLQVVALTLLVPVIFVLGRGIEYSVSLKNAEAKNTMSAMTDMLFIYDLSGASVENNSLFLPREVFQENGTDEELLLRLKTFYNIRSCDFLFGAGNAPLSTDSEQFKRGHSFLLKAWIDLLTQNLVLYLKHRFNVFGFHLSAAGQVPQVPVYWAVEANDLGIHQHSNVLRDKITPFIDRLTSSWIYHGWVYCLLLFSSFLGAFVFKIHNRGLIFIMTLTVISLQVVNFFSIYGVDFRYNVWSFFASFLSLIVFIEGLVFRKIVPDESLEKLALDEVQPQHYYKYQPFALGPFIQGLFLLVLIIFCSPLILIRLLRRFFNGAI